MSKIILELVWFEKIGDRLIDKIQIETFNLQELRSLFNLTQDNPMYDSYPIATSEQVEYFSSFTDIDTNSFDYFVGFTASVL